MDWMVRIYWFLFESLYGVLHLNSWLTIICSNIAFFCSSCIFAYLCFLCIVFFFVLDLNIHIYEEESWCSGKSCRLVIRRSRVQVVDTGSCKNCREWLRIKIPSDLTLLWIPRKAGASCTETALFILLSTSFFVSWHPWIEVVTEIACPNRKQSSPPPVYLYLGAATFQSLPK
jgi:hypothetical protein